MAIGPEIVQETDGICLCVQKNEEICVCPIGMAIQEDIEYLLKNDSNQTRLGDHMCYKRKTIFFLIKNTSV